MYATESHSGTFFYFEEMYIAISRVARSHGFRVGSAYVEGEFKLTEIQTRRLQAFALHRCREAKANGENLYIASNFQADDEDFGKEATAYKIVSPRGLFEEMTKLTFVMQSHLTLQMLRDAEQILGKGVKVAAKFGAYPGELLPESESHRELSRFTPGGIDCEPLVYVHHLLDSGLVRYEEENADGSTIYITPKGYASLDPVLPSS